MKARLCEAFVDHPHVAEVRGCGLLLAVELVENREPVARYPRDQGITTRVVAEGLRRGVSFYPGGTGEVRDIVALGPPFTVEDEELDLMADVLVDAVDTVTRS